MTVAPPPRPSFAPRHWLAWLGVGVYMAMAQLPWPLQRALGAVLGRLALWLAVSRRRAARTNLRLCLPELAETERETLLRANFRDVGIGLFEFARAWWGEISPLRASASIEGLEILERLRNQGRGVLLVSGHFMTLELCGRLLCDHITLAGMYRRYKDPVMEWAVLRGRLRYAYAMFGNRDTRAALRHLKGGGVLWYAPDQDMLGKDTVFAPFFGIPAATITATHQFARMTGCAVVPFFHRRDGGRYILRVGQPLDPFPTEDAVQDTSRVNAAIEAMVRDAPSQYLWLHRRFKRQPDGASRYD
ncbi:MAG: LpxL/LpxP family Kdo(2)-lipid IV(A) lauroyl/palmitoleoyl acyltransferase [Thermomonas sp.]|uniref:LpxL/LpxP family Kdo(2)-lipid IV(A) lauroyl/palmitoleoyl acyltransferase n=1 Tax=Thermomonas sp. TaxID=1971895 RepID=UPI00261CEF95|nr:LpxL/LpxP family Kdo(2)-lipid IV(A) lauroyl/palmitoleoyl acyltransferase [Thermomonas sp.]MCC7095964.1 LpxL/LpxP family Kdo(2)-lipid IV(A) lauroyl/palmitoleoyl acyltransferase [Thermomonas sp.]